MLDLNEIIKYQNELAELKVKCSCGHVKMMPVFLDKVVCDFCGKTIRNNTRQHFKYKLRKLMKEK